VRQHDAPPEQDQDHQLIVDEVWDHGMAPLHDGDRRPFYLVFRPKELSAAIGYTTVPAVLALMTLLIARSLFPRPADLESKTPHVGTSGYRRGYWWFVIAAGLVGAGFADFPLMAYHFKGMALMEDQWMPTSYSAAMVLAMLAGLLGGKLFDRLGMTVVMGLAAVAAFFAPLVFEKRSGCPAACGGGE
jgi:hypothetical protein